MIEGLFGVVIAVITATAAVRLDRFFEQVDRRRDLYLEVLTYLDNVAVMIMEQIVKSAPDNSTMLEVERTINTMKTRLDLLASQQVRKAYEDYRQAWPNVMDAAIAKPDPKQERSTCLTNYARAWQP